MVVIRKINIEITQGRTFSIKNTRVKSETMTVYVNIHVCFNRKNGETRLLKGFARFVMHILFKQFFFFITICGKHRRKRRNEQNKYKQ